MHLLTDITPDELSRLKDDLASGAKHPRQVKEDLAKAMVARYHSRAAAEHEAAGVYSGPAGAGTAGGDRGGDFDIGRLRPQVRDRLLYLIRRQTG